jgi:hypothetical protein
MLTQKRIVAALQTVLLLPAILFLTSVLVATGDPPQYGLAHAAHRIVEWYSERMWTLGLLLLLLPFSALVAGCAALLRDWQGNTGTRRGAARAPLTAKPAPLATLIVGWATVTSAGILGVVVLHMLAN